MASVLENLSIDRVRADVERICTEIPSRLPGSPNGTAMAAFSAERLRAAGAQAEVHKIPGLVSFPEGTRLSVDRPGISDMPANSFAHSVATDGPITGELIDVGGCSEAECAAAGIAGKIVLCELSYAPARQEKERIAARHGAAGAVMFNWGHDTSDALPMGSVKAVWGNPTPEEFSTAMPALPCIGISRRDGLRLKAECARRSGPTVSFAVNSVDAWRPVAITVGEIAAAAPTRELVLVGGHQDSWFGEAATDNATGSACLIELARVFSPVRDQLRRNLLFGFWAGHETGTMIGSSWFAETNWDRLRDGLMAYVQIDQPGIAGTTVWQTTASDELAAFAEAINAKAHPGAGQRHASPIKMGDTSFFGLGVPLLQSEGGFTDMELAANGGAGLGWWHHTLDCTLDKVGWQALEEHLRQYARYVHGLATSPVVPIRFSRSAASIDAALGALNAGPCRIDISDLIPLAAELKRSAAAFDEAIDALRQVPSPAEGVLALANDAARAVCRKLVPIMATVCEPYGQDTYGLTAQAAALPPLAGIAGDPAGAAGPADWMLQTRLRRNRNRVADCLIDANSALAAAADGIRNHL